jgi:uncharacterized protein (DUF924 family)
VDDANSRVDRVLEFWFGALDPHGLADAEHAARWWKKDPELDDSIRREFSTDHRAIARHERQHWLATPRARLAYVIVLDQFSRNIFRGTSQMFAYDERALEAALDGIQIGADRQLRTDQRAFYYLPLMHSERLDLQERCVELFTAFANELSGEPRQRIAYNLRFAVQHRDIIARFGRFPHRNAVLNRVSTDAELQFLTKPGSSF